MRYFIAALLLVLPLSYAASDYIVAVGEDAPVSDVVFAANFASYMKQKSGVDFTGMIDRELYEENSDNLDGLASSSVLLINGEEKYALYIRGEDTSSKHRAVEEDAIDYLEDEGYDIVRFVGVEREGTELRDYYPQDYTLVPGDLLIGPLTSHDAPEGGYGGPVVVIDEEAEPVVVELPADDDSPAAVPTIEAVPVVAETPNQTQNETPAAEPVVAQVEPEQPGAVARFFSWLTGLFS